MQFKPVILKGHLYKSEHPWDMLEQTFYKPLRKHAQSHGRLFHLIQEVGCVLICGASQWLVSLSRAHG